MRMSNEATRLTLSTRHVCLTFPPIFANETNGGSRIDHERCSIAHCPLPIAYRIPPIAFIHLFIRCPLLLQSNLKSQQLITTSRYYQSIWPSATREKRTKSAPREKMCAHPTLWPPRFVKAKRMGQQATVMNVMFRLYFPSVTTRGEALNSTSERA